MTTIAPSTVRLSPIPEVVDILRKALERAERGELRAVVIATHVHMPGCENGTGSAYEIGDGNVANLVCAIEHAKLRLLGYGTGEGA